MRVNVTYSVELSEIKQIVEELILKLEDDLEEVNSTFPQIQDFLQDSNESMAIEKIERCRTNLSNLEHSLYDCQNILTGYQQAVLHLKSSKDAPVAQKKAGSESENVEGG